MLYKQASLVSYDEKREALTSLELVLTVLSSALNRAGEFPILSCLSSPFSLPLSFFLSLWVHTYCVSRTRCYPKHGVCCSKQDRPSLCHLRRCILVGKMRIEQLKKEVLPGNIGTLLERVVRKGRLLQEEVITAKRTEGDGIHGY